MKQTLFFVKIAEEGFKNFKFISMQPWEIALNTFLAEWEKEEHFVGALLCGSHAVGTANSLSDVDVHIILSDKASWRERGNKTVNGIQIEYFVNPKHKIHEYLIEQYAWNSYITVRMFATGKTVRDPYGEMKKLQNWAKQEVNRKFKKMTKARIELEKYHLWYILDNLKDLHMHNSLGFIFLYHNALDKAFHVYAEYLQMEIHSEAKLYKYFSSNEYRHKYKMPAFPDQQFTRLFITALKKQSYSNIVKLINHVIIKMGGLKLENWHLRTSAN